MNLGDPAYWEVRYKREIAERAGPELELFDWYCPFSEVYPLIQSVIDTTIVHRVLVLGVGRSNVIEYLYRQGYRDITAIDISETIILEMQQKYADHPGVEFLCMDVRQMYKFSDGYFSLILEKACLDTLFCATDYMESVPLAAQEICRVLKPEGVFVTVTHAPPIARVPYYRLVPTWAIESYKIPSTIGESLTMFVMTKTDNENMLKKRIPGAEAFIRTKAGGVVTAMDQNLAKGSNARAGQNTGVITVTTSVDVLAKLVEKSDETD